MTSRRLAIQRLGGAARFRSVGVGDRGELDGLAPVHDTSDQPITLSNAAPATIQYARNRLEPRGGFQFVPMDDV